MPHPAALPYDTPRSLEVGLSHVLGLLDPCDVECDGFVRLATTLLHELGVPHTVRVGRLVGGGVEVPLHFWLEVSAPDGTLLVADYRARMWCGSQAPHGVQRTVPEGEWHRIGAFRYYGEPSSMAPLPGYIFALLADRPLAATVAEARNRLGMRDVE